MTWRSGKLANLGEWQFANRDYKANESRQAVAA